MHHRFKKHPVKEVIEVARRITATGVVVVLYSNGSQRVVDPLGKAAR